MNIEKVTFTFKMSPEENLALVQKALKEAVTSGDRMTINQMYGHYVKTLPQHVKLLKLEMENNLQSDGESSRIEFAIAQ